MSGVKHLAELNPSHWAHHSAQPLLTASQALSATPYNTTCCWTISSPRAAATLLFTSFRLFFHKKAAVALGRCPTGWGICSGAYQRATTSCAQPHGPQLHQCYTGHYRQLMPGTPQWTQQSVKVAAGMIRQLATVRHTRLCAHLLCNPDPQNTLTTQTLPVTQHALSASQLAQLVGAGNHMPVSQHTASWRVAAAPSSRPSICP